MQFPGLFQAISRLFPGVITWILTQTHCTGSTLDTTLLIFRNSTMVGADLQVFMTHPA